MGDPAGIGPELCLRALREPSILKICAPIIFGDLEALRKVGKAIGIKPSLKPIGLDEISVHQISSAVVQCGSLNVASLQPGKVSAQNGRASFDYIRESIRAACAGAIDAVVTAPVNKEALHKAGVPFPGHTEIFTALTKSKRSCMMLASKPLTVSMATTHIGYGDVPKTISVERILDVIELTHQTLRWIKKKEPRLAVCGLNPHAGENGLFGNREEERFIIPAIELARKKGIQITGPLPPDTAFVARYRKNFDAIICQYHDQGHIPFKMLAFDTGVNITIGLPIIRTSVDHGTAFDIAWRGIASPTSLYSAIRMAVKLHRGKINSLQTL